METINYWPLFYIFIIAWFVPLLLSWLEVAKVPSVIVEILLGVLIGPFVLDLIPDTPYIEFLANTGFLFLIFLAGLEIDLNKIIFSLQGWKAKDHKLMNNTLVVSLVIYVGSLALSVPVSWLLNNFFESDITFYSLLFPTVALSIIVPIIKSDGEIKQSFGQILLTVGAIATIMSIILISIYSGILKHGIRFELLLFLIIFIVFVITYSIGKRLINNRVFQKLLYKLEHAASQIRVRGTVALLLLFVTIAHLINTELVMGAFFAGILLSMFVVKERSALLFKLDGMSYGFFIPVFFIMVGVNLDVSALASIKVSLPLISAIVLGFFITQVLPAVIMAKIFGLKKALSGGFLLTSRLGLTIAAAQIGLSLGVIGTGENAAIVSAAIVSSLISPLIYRMLNVGSHQYHQIVIFGGSLASLYLAERFRLHSISCMTFLQKEDMIKEFEEKGIPHQYVNELNTEVIGSLDLLSSELVVILTESKSLNLDIASYLKDKVHHKHIITRKQSASHNLIGPDSGVKLIDNNEILAHYVEDLVVRPDSISSLAVSFDNYSVEEIKITNNNVHRKLVKNLAFPPSGSLVIQRRGGEIFIPHGNTHLLVGDIVTVIGNSAALSDFRNILEK